MSVDDEIQIVSFDQVVGLTRDYRKLCIDSGLEPSMATRMALELHRIVLTDFLDNVRADD